MSTLLLGGCAHHASPAQLGPDALYQQAMEAYRAGKNGRAIQLLDEFLRAHVGDPRAPSARMTLGRAHMARKEYILAAGEFTRLINESPPDSLQRTARFEICESYMRLSPKPQLDQEYTTGALAHCESIGTYYPGTPEAERAGRWVGELQQKLAQKSYDTGLFYMKRGAYDAAVIYFNETVQQYPRTSVAPAALLRLVESYRTIGYKEEAEEARTRLVRDYPQSAEAKSPLLQQPQPAVASNPTG
ncbi:MAG: outer membrane protein assembly factor BamD [Gemmatimonadetes bacterium]|nr:outer membrane protein assembly factor BamD [Gemmatimonadota bacterium]